MKVHTVVKKLSPTRAHVLFDTHFGARGLVYERQDDGRWQEPAGGAGLSANVEAACDAVKVGEETTLKVEWPTVTSFGREWPAGRKGGAWG